MLIQNLTEVIHVLGIVLRLNGVEKVSTKSSVEIKFNFGGSINTPKTTTENLQSKRNLCVVNVFTGPFPDRNPPG